MFFKKIPFVAALLNQTSEQQEAIIPSEQVSFEQATQNQPTAVDAETSGNIGLSKRSLHTKFK